jgi:hypothetical protein
MIQFFRNGGWSMFVIVAFGVLAVASAAFYAARPDGRREGFLAWMSRAVLWSTLAGLASDLGATCQFVTSLPDADERARAASEGFAESMSPAVMGFALLAVTAFLAAIGRQRLDARRESASPE